MRALICLLLAVSCFGATANVSHNPGVLAFEARNGQYVSHGAGYALSVTSGGAMLTLGGHAVRMSVVRASPKSSLEALDRMPGRANYLLGRDVRASYDLYGRVRWRGVYPGIDLVYRGNQEHLEYDFEIGAGRDPRRIKLGFEGVDEMRIDGNGDLVLEVGTVQIHQPKPVAYQVVAGKRQPVNVTYLIDASNHVRFRTGAYDRERALVIDPQIVFDKPFGGGLSAPSALARDAQGGLYVTGSTASADFGTVNPIQPHLGGGAILATGDGGKTFSFPLLAGARYVTAIVAAPSAPLTVYAATQLGLFQSTDGGTTWTAPANSGLTGDVTAVAVDASSPATLYCATSNQTTHGFFVSTDGAATWRASMNGLTGFGISSIAADPAQTGTVYASVQSPPGFFRSADFGQTWTQLTFAPNQLATGFFEILIASNGTIFGTTSQGLLISTDGGMTWTAGAGLPNMNSQTLAILPINPDILYLVTSFSAIQLSTDAGKTFGTLLHDTHLNGNARIAVDPRDSATVYVTDFNLLYRSTDRGVTFLPLPLPNFINPQTIFISPVDSRVFLGIFTPSNVFVTKWSADGSRVLYSTYLGGSARDQANAIAVDANGSAYVTGVTSSSDFPTTPGAFQTQLTTTQDAFVAKLSADGSQLIYSTLLGSDLSIHECCQPIGPASLAVDNAGNAVITGFIEGKFPVTANAFQTKPVSGCYMPDSPVIPISGDAFVTRIAADGKSLISSTLLGGSCASYGTGVVLDASGNAWISGGTLSPDFPVTSDALQPKFGGGTYDGFLARFTPSGGLSYATYIGGAGYDILNAIALDKSGNIYMTGESGGLSQPASPGAFQPQASGRCPQFFIGPSFPVVEGNALVMKLDPTGHSIQRLTYLGAPLCLLGSSIAVDSSGQPWILGPVLGGTVQTANPFQIGIGQGFISKFSADLTQLLFSTYFDSVAGLALDSSGSAYVAGTGAQAYVAKIDPTPAAISLDSVVSPVPAETAFCFESACELHPATFRGIAAGELIRVLGKQMGPAATTPGVIQSGVLATTVAGAQVTFDGVAVPLLSVSAQEIDLMGPFELAGKSSTTIQVQYNGVKSNPVQVSVTGTVLQILDVFNEDFTFNTPSNPAKAGSIMTLYLSGVGQTNPPSQDGQVNAAPLAALSSPIQITWVSVDFKTTTIPAISFAGAAPGLAAGIFQVNFAAPQQSLMRVYLSMGNDAVPFNVFVQ